jgi:hypothetical protein
MPIPSTMADLSITAASNFPAGSESPTTGDDYLRAYAAILRTTNAKGADIASATTTDIGAATGEFVDVTGTTTITGLGTIAAGIKRTVRFTGALTLTHNATSLILPGSANITTANGDVATFRSLGSGNWKCTSYISQAGLTPGAISKTDLQNDTYIKFTTGGTNTAYTGTPSPALASLTTGHRFTVTFNATAGTNPTLAISGLTAKNLKYYDSTGTKQAVTATQVVANLISDVVYDGTDYVVLNAAGAVNSAATNASYVTGTATNEYLTPAVARARNLVLGTSVASTSGTSIDFTGIPSWVKRITIMLAGVSTSGTSNPLFQIGDAGGVEVSAYSSASGVVTGSAVTNKNYTTGFGLNGNLAANSLHGTVVLILLDAATNTWACNGQTCLSNSNISQFICGSKALSATLDRVRITTEGGTDTFDAGLINIIYE